MKTWIFPLLLISLNSVFSESNIVRIQQPDILSNEIPDIDYGGGDHISDRETRDFASYLKEYQIKKERVTKMAELFVWQASEENEQWQQHHVNLITYFNEKVVFKVCGSKKEMNFMNLEEHLNTLRKKYKKSMGTKVEVMIEDNPLRGNMTYNMTTTWGYTTTEVWTFEMEKSYKPNLAYKVLGLEAGVVDYFVTKIEQGGGCSEIGITNTDKIYSETVNTHLRMGRDFGVEVLQLLYQPFDDYEWHLLFDLSDNFEGTTCVSGRKIYKIFDYLKYMKSFYEKWEISLDAETIEKEHFHIIRNEKDRFIFKLVVPFVTNSTNDEVEWEFKFLCINDEHGDGRWRVKKMDQICPTSIGGLKGVVQVQAKIFIQEIADGIRRLLKMDPPRWEEKFEHVDSITLFRAVTEINIKNANIVTTLWALRNSPSVPEEIVYSDEFADPANSFGIPNGDKYEFEFETNLYYSKSVTTLKWNFKAKYTQGNWFVEELVVNARHRYNIRLGRQASLHKD